MSCARGRRSGPDEADPPSRRSGGPGLPGHPAVILGEVVGEHAEPHARGHPVMAPVATPPQPVRPLQSAEGPFPAGAPSLRPPEGGAMFVAWAGGRFLPPLRNRHGANRAVPPGLLVRRTVIASRSR